MQFFESAGLGNQLASAGINTVTGLIKGAVDNAYAKQAFNRQADMQKWLMRYGPSLQVNALRQAGLNPALLTGSPETVSAPSSGSGQSGYSGSTFDPGVALIDSQRNLMAEQAWQAHQGGEYQRIMAIQESDLTPGKKRLLQEQILTAQKDREEVDSRIKLNGVNLNLNKRQLWEMIETWPTRMKQVVADLDITYANKRKINAEVRQIGENIKFINAQTELAGKQSQEIQYKLDNWWPNVVNNLGAEYNQLDNENSIKKYILEQMNTLDPKTREYLQKTGKFVEVIGQLVMSYSILRGLSGRGAGNFPTNGYTITPMQ